MQLALKHRQNKNQRQRVIVFVGSPLETASAADLVKLGKRLKKNNVAVDVVSFGEVEENLDKLQQFIDAVNSADNRCVVVKTLCEAAEQLLTSFLRYPVASSASLPVPDSCPI